MAGIRKSLLFITVVFIPVSFLFAQNPETIDKDKTNEIQQMSDKSIMVHKISIFSDIEGTLGNLHTLLPNSWGVSLAYENNLAGIIPANIAPFLHGARLEAGYTSYSIKDPISQIRLELGPQWFLSFWPAKFGKIQLSAMPGITWIHIQSTGAAIQGVTFSASLLAGYEYDFGAISQNPLLSHLFLFIHGRMGYVYDKTSPWTGMGADFGVGMRI